MMFLQRATGGWVSLTTTLKPQVWMPPSPSMITTVTGFVPTSKVEPFVGEQTTFVTTQPSTAGTVHVTLLLLHSPSSAAATMFVGHGKSRLNVSTVTWS